MEDKEKYIFIIDPKKPKGDPERYLIAKAWIIPFLASDLSILGMFDTLEAALIFLAKLL